MKLNFSLSNLSNWNKANMKLNFSLLNWNDWNKAKAKRILFQLLMGMLGAAILMLVFHVMEPPQRIVTVDVTGMINRFVKAEGQAKVSSDQLKKQVEIFGETLNTTLHEVAKNRQVVLLPKEAVIAGATDISGFVEARIKAKLPGLSLDSAAASK